MSSCCSRAERCSTLKHNIILLNLKYYISKLAINRIFLEFAPWHVSSVLFICGYYAVLAIFWTNIKLLGKP